ncbi:hypothetical protein Btru_023861 [Bulinus truncatus]|nr:hypothetical protein Btru_023861 [Bulinus truncatus]
MASKNYFETLGVTLGADENQIKKAYRTLAKKWHPDKNSDPGAKEKFQEIAAAYEYLSSKDRREMLERELLRRSTQPPQKPTQQTTTKPSAPYSSDSSPKKSSKKPNAASWSETFTKNYRSQQAKSKASGDKSSNFTYENQNHNFKFEDFRSQKPSSPVSEEDDIFSELFGQFFTSMRFTGLSEDLMGSSQLERPKKFVKKKQRTRQVAPEKGSADGLDEEYLFTPRHKAEDGFEEKLSCPWCNQAFTRGKLSQHEEKCGKFGLSADEESEDETDSNINYITTLSQPLYSWKPKWQQRQDEMRDKIRRDKMLYRDHLVDHKSKDDGLIKCPYCERQFNSASAGKHIPWCKEHVQKYGVPMSRRSSTGKNSLSKLVGEKNTKDIGMARERMKEYARKNLHPSPSRESRQKEFNRSGNDMPFKSSQGSKSERMNSFDDFFDEEHRTRSDHNTGEKTFQDGYHKQW